ncbi:MAG: cupin-like domain-containing protein [Rudaea sp.]
MQRAEHPIREIAGVSRDALPAELLRGDTPVVLRGLVADWPLVRAGLDGPARAIDYLSKHARDGEVVAMIAAPEFGGRLFYNADLSGFNFRVERARLDSVLAAMRQQLDAAQTPTLYMGSTTVETFFPGLATDNQVALDAQGALYSIWIGNRTRIAAHQDLPDNLACVAVGHRRFTLFPPAQLANLYIGPLDFTPAGQAISLVDFAAPDFARFPRFAAAIDAAQTSVLGPGDALFIPSLWWHHIEALDRFNVLMNYWWRQSPDFMDTPMNALMLAILAVRDLPPAQRAAWQEIFRHYVFEAGAAVAAHVPEAARRVLAPLTPDVARDLRARLLKRINR